MSGPTETIVRLRGLLKEAASVIKALRPCESCGHSECAAARDILRAIEGQVRA